MTECVQIHGPPFSKKGQA
uniref:Uncharacterized protein n=1 Tax=Anguilla anguilla TaxID=7936 RepID=A0A0E9XAT7_ANGAN